LRGFDVMTKHDQRQRIDWDRCLECGGTFPDGDPKWRVRAEKNGAIGVRHVDGGCPK